jgi:hypothetical protein
MAVVNTKATAVTNADASPVVLNNPAVAKGRVFSAVGTLEVAATDSAASVYRFARIPSSAVVRSIKVFNDDLDSTGAGVTFDCGLHKTAADGGAAVDANVFASDIATCQAANLTGVEIRFEVADLNGIEKRAWELAAATADPNIDYDVTLTLGGTITGLAAGTISVLVEYSVA